MARRSPALVTTKFNPAVHRVGESKVAIYMVHPFIEKGIKTNTEQQPRGSFPDYHKKKEGWSTSIPGKAST